MIGLQGGFFGSGVAGGSGVGSSPETIAIFGPDTANGDHTFTYIYNVPAGSPVFVDIECWMQIPTADATGTWTALCDFTFGGVPYSSGSIFTNAVAISGSVPLGLGRNSIGSGLEGTTATILADGGTAITLTFSVAGCTGAPAWNTYVAIRRIAVA